MKQKNIKVNASEGMINIAFIIGLIGFIINAPYLYTAGAGTAHQLGKILWIIPVDEPTIIIVPYGTIQPMLIGIFLIAFAGMLGIASVFATIFEGLKNPSRSTDVSQTQNFLKRAKPI